jgi:uncharacterized membrane protein
MRKYFVTGLVILLPLALTVAIVAFIVDFLTKPFLGLVEPYFGNFSFFQIDFGIVKGQKLLHYFGEIIVLIALFVFTILLGILGRWFLIHSLIKVGDEILHKIPVINKVYKTSQEVIKSIFSEKTRSFKQVVLAPFPSSRSYSLGLVTRESPKISSNVDFELVSVFLPTTPNPTSGYLLMFKPEDLIYSDMAVEDAVRFIISCGVIHPEEKEMLENGEIPPRMKGDKLDET